jgi:hypothetical protein
MQALGELRRVVSITGVPAWKTDRFRAKPLRQRDSGPLSKLSRGSLPDSDHESRRAFSQSIYVRDCKLGVRLVPEQFG